MYSAWLGKQTFIMTNTAIQKRSLTIAGHRTSISLEAEFWQGLKHIAGEEQRSLAALVAEIDEARGTAGLSSALRLYVLNYYKAKTQ